VWQNESTSLSLDLGGLWPTRSRSCLNRNGHAAGSKLGFQSRDINIDLLWTDDIHAYEHDDLEVVE